MGDKDETPSTFMAFTGRAGVTDNSSQVLMEQNKLIDLTNINSSTGNGISAIESKEKATKELITTKITLTSANKEEAVGTRLGRLHSLSLPSRLETIHKDDIYLQSFDSELCSLASSDCLLDDFSNASSPIDQRIDTTPDKFKLVKEKLSRGLTTKLSPAEEWQLKKGLNVKENLSRAASKVIKSGWKIRHELHKIKRSPEKSVNTFYLDIVSSGAYEDVKALFDYVKADPSLKFDKHFVNERDRDALRIAIDNEDLPMCKLLLDKKIDLRLNIFHAIERNFFKGVEAILKKNPSTKLCIKHYNYYFKVGMTPLILAAHHNNYEILKLLYNYGHRMRRLLNFLQDKNVDINDCRDQVYDNAGNMSGKYGGLQARIKELSPSAEDLLSSALCACGSHFLVVKRMSDTRWSARTDATRELLCNFSTIKEVLDDLLNNSDQKAESVNWWDGIQHALESANERTLMFTAKASPAYITLICEENQHNPMEFCFDLIKELRNSSQLENEFSEFYQKLEHQIEDYMCHLLDQVQSSEELANLFEYDFDAYWNEKSDLFGKGAVDLQVAQSRLFLLDQASDYKLVKFVTHRNSQLALSYVRYCYTAFFKLQCKFVKILFSLMFPIWSLFYLVAPRSKLGGIITLPNISYSCHVTSDVIFIILLITKIAVKSPETQYLGSPPTTLEWLILLWILGKFVQEIRQSLIRGLKYYIRDFWNYIDITQLVFFGTVIVLRIVDFFLHLNDTVRLTRNQWGPFEPRVISTVFLAWAYVFAFLRVLSLMRTNRVIGPLQVSVAKMLVDVVQFFSIFGVILISFSLALTELYWYYGTPEGKDVVCGNVTETDCEVIFSGIRPSLGELFWSLFGYFELSAVPFNNQLAFIYWAAIILLGTYHVVAVIILINMLIAMMAQSFEVTTENRDVEWKFHRTVVWIRFVRREFTRPPPMNLLPNPYTIFAKIKKCLRWLALSVFNYQTEEEKLKKWKMLRRRTNDDVFLVQRQLRQLENAAFAVKKNLRKVLSKKVQITLVERYKFSKLLDGCAHHHHGETKGQGSMHHRHYNLPAHSHKT